MYIFFLQIVRLPGKAKGQTDRQKAIQRNKRYIKMYGFYVRFIAQIV